MFWHKPFLKKIFYRTFGKRFVKTSLCRNFDKMAFKKEEKPTLRWKMFSQKLFSKTSFQNRSLTGTSTRV
jgi:hypothetical protein